MLSVIIFIVVALVFSAGMLYVLQLIPSRDILPAAVSPDVARKHVPLICLVRAHQILLAAGLLTIGALIFLGFLLSTNPFLHHSAYGEAYSVSMWIIALLLVAAFVAKSIDRHRKSGTGFFRAFLRVDTNSVSTFAFIFAAFAAHDVYQLMPPWKPQLHMSVLAQFLNRDFLCIPVFLLGRSCAITILRRVLELNPETPPRNPEPPDQSDSGPRVPFDPYILPNNRPLHPCGS